MVDASELHGEFVLSSGATSTVYFDKFRFLTRADLLRDVAHAVAELLAPGTELLGAPEGAAMLLVAAVSLETGLPVSVVRKQAKAYGTKEQVEGPCPAGAVTTLLEDVSTTGSSGAACGGGAGGGRRHGRAHRAGDRPGRRRSPSRCGLQRRGGRGASADGLNQTRSQRQIRSCHSHRLPRWRKLTSPSLTIWVAALDFAIRSGSGNSRSITERM